MVDASQHATWTPSLTLRPGAEGGCAHQRWRHHRRKGARGHPWWQRTLWEQLPCVQPRQGGGGGRCVAPRVLLACTAGALTAGGLPGCDNYAQHSNLASGGNGAVHLLGLNLGSYSSTR